MAEGQGSLRNLPLHSHDQKIWCEIVALACKLLAWTQMLAPARPRLPLGTKKAAAADLLRSRAHRPRRPAPTACIAAPSPGADQITAGIDRIRALAPR